MKLPSCTVRTRSFVGSKIKVSVTDDSREASVTDRGMVYGPPPTRNAVLGGEMITCADPRPDDVVGTAGGVAGAAGCGAAGCGGVAGCDVVAGGVAGGGCAGGVGAAAGGGAGSGFAGADGGGGGGC